MGIYRRLNYGTAFDITSGWGIGVTYNVTIAGVLSLSIITSGQPGPSVNLKIAYPGGNANVFAVWGHNGGGAEYNIAPFSIPVFPGNSLILEKVGGGGGSIQMACIIPYSDN